MLAFALRHALKHNLRRVVVVIPYLTILEQTVNEYRSALAEAYPAESLDSVILEHHSLAGTRESGQESTADRKEVERKILAENWNAPFVIRRACSSWSRCLRTGLARAGSCTAWRIPWCSWTRSRRLRRGWRFHPWRLSRRSRPGLERA
jgi:hypothetical protein